MNQIIWSSDKIFNDSNGNIISVLQRPLRDIDNAVNDELLPFFHELSLFQFSQYNRKNIERVIGSLTNFNKEKDDICISIKSSTGGVISRWILAKYFETIMTVWRINNELDTLQINLKGEKNELYMQTGGALLIKIFRTCLKAPNPCYEIEQAEKIFAQNAVPIKMNIANDI